MEYVSSCQSIQIWENMCVTAVKNGHAKMVHNGKGNDDICCYTREYEIYLKASIYPVPVKFWYDTRKKDKSVRKDVASVKITIEGLILILQAVANREINVNLPEMSITRLAEGIRIEQK